MHVKAVGVLVYRNNGRAGSLTSASLSDDSDCDGTTDTALTFLHTKVGEENRKDILGTQTFGNVTKRVDSRSSDALFVGLQQVQELEADTHPFSGRYKFSSTIS